MEGNRLDNLLKLLEKQPEDAFLNYAAALEYDAAGNIEKAELFYNKLFSQHPDYLPQYYQLGLFLIKKGNLDKALEIFRKGMELAKKQNDNKTFLELKEVFENLEDELE
jgi:tetratricopeptide (TPR) repeat protein